MGDMQNSEFNFQKPKRKKRSQLQIFKETYLPVIIAGLAIVLVFIFIIGSITRAVQRHIKSKQEAEAASIALFEENERQKAEAAQLVAQARLLASSYDYESAINLLATFTGDYNAFPEITQLSDEYEESMGQLVEWNDPGQILNLSFQVLIADPALAFSDPTYGPSYNKNFVTTEEFTGILHQLYNNGYVLIKTTDMVNGTSPKSLYLPAGKKPLILTQTQVNYYKYMLNSGGFASKLIIDENGNISCTYTNANGEVSSGAYDLVPILESFIQTHPDFSYKGARAIIAVTGYDGLFGYRTNASAQSTLGTDAFAQEVSDATKITEALRNSGYEIACYTYGNVAYGSFTAEQIREDLNRWNTEVSPILGVVQTLVFACNSDIAGRGATYSDEKFYVLEEFGFNQYLGFAVNGSPWFSTQDTCIRHGRLLVTGSNMKHHSDWFNGIFNCDEILDPIRGEIPA